MNVICVARRQTTFVLFAECPTVKNVLKKLTTDVSIVLEMDMTERKPFK